MSQALDKWYDKLKDYDVALFYFSGHGSQVGDINYLYPIDANPKSKYDLSSQTYLANKVVEKLSDTTLRCGIIILDACRSNPFIRSWNRDVSESGLISMAGRGTFIGFAASPGETASDGKVINGISQRNGIYTQAILNYITQKGLSLNEIFTKVNNEVRLQTKNEQVTFMSSSLNSDFCFNVSFYKSDSVKRSVPTFRQSSTEMVFSPDQDKLYIIDTNVNSLLVKNLNSTNNIHIFGSRLHPYMLAKGLRNIYILDSIQKSIFIIDPKQDTVKSVIKLSDTPLSISISNNEKNAYVLQENPKNQTELIKIDLRNKNINHILNITGRGNSIITNSDDSKVFITAIRKDSGLLFKFDTKTLKLEDSSLANTNLLILALSSNGSELYIKSSRASSTESQLMIAKSSSLKFNDTIQIDVKCLEVCNDSSYLLISDKNGMNVLRRTDNSITNVIYLPSSPSSSATSNHYVSYIWLPQENRTFVKSMQGNLQPIHVLTPDEKFRSFVIENNSKYRIDEGKRVKAVLETIGSSVANGIQALVDTLGTSFNNLIPLDYAFYDYPHSSLKMNTGIESSVTKKRIVVSILAKVQEDELTFIMTDEKKESVTKFFSITKDEFSGHSQDNFIKIVKKFFKERIYQLQ